MTAITFPNSPSSGDTHTAGNGIVYTYDGEKWTSIGTNSAGTWTRSGTTVSLTNAGDDLNVDSGTLFVDASTNRVGIGTSNPLTLLDVQGSNGRLFIADGGASNEMKLISQNAAGSGNAALAFQSHSLEYGRFDSSGNLGIGTTTFPVNGTNLKISDGTIARNVLEKTGSNARIFEIGNGGTFLNVYDATADSERLRIDSSGRVGIGVSDPGSYYGNGNDLVVGGGASHGITIKAGNTHQAIIAFADGTAANTQLYPGYILYDHATDHVQFATAALERMRIDAAGNVTLKPTDPAGISGSYSNFLGFRVTQTNGQSALLGTIRAIGQSAWGGDLVFATKPNNSTPNDALIERMKIKSGGRVDIFAGNTSDALFVGSAFSAGTSADIMRGMHSASSIGGGTTSFRIATNGNVFNTNNSYGSISDAKLKENIVDASSQWDDIKDLRVRNYNFIEGQTHTQIGVVAQEVETVSPGLVLESPDRDEDGNDLGTTTKSVNYSVLYMKAVKALQEAMDRIETLEAKVAALEAS